jgi:hypothetical protein
MDEKILISTIDSLEETALEIERNMEQLFGSAEVEVNKVRLKPFNPTLKELHRETIRKYQQWYSSSLHLITQYLPEKAVEFSKLYSVHEYHGGEGVFDLVCFDHLFRDREDLERMSRMFSQKFEVQRSILLSIPAISQIKEISLREIISAFFAEREIQEADYLFKRKYVRCAGALAGVALEQHLRTLCDKYGLEYNPKDTIEPLAQNLYENGKIDKTELKRIQYLASIRDSCDHASDVDSDQVKELIERVKKMI